MAINWASINAGGSTRTLQGSGLGQPGPSDFVITSMPEFERPGYQAPPPVTNNVIQQQPSAQSKPPVWIQLEEMANDWHTKTESMVVAVRQLKAFGSLADYDPWFIRFQDYLAFGSDRSRRSLEGVKQLSEGATRLNTLIGKLNDQAQADLDVFNQFKNSTNKTDLQRAAGSFDRAQDTIAQADSADGILVSVLTAIDNILAALSAAWDNVERALDRLTALYQRTRTALIEQGQRDQLGLWQKQNEVNKALYKVADTNAHSVEVITRAIEKLDDKDGGINIDVGDVGKVLMWALGIGAVAFLGSRVLSRR